MGTTIFLLADCNNFFVSCERIFRPDLYLKPVAVLSNNDGVIVSRSPELKKMGIPMGLAAFKVSNEIKNGAITVFSSNFSLYRDISARVMKTFETLCQDVEIYSIDEAFLRFNDVDEDEITATAFMIKNAVATNIGIPVGIGIARTKTLAKLANHYAKQHPESKGIYSVMRNESRLNLLKHYAVDEVWGVGRRLSEKLKKEGVNTALDLAEMDENHALKIFNINLLRTIRELNDKASVAHVDDDENQQQIMWSRSFKDRISAYEDLLAALNNYVSEAAIRLRALGKYAKRIGVFIRTSYFGNQQKYAGELAFTLDYATSDTRVLASAAENLLRQIYKKGFLYAKAGVILSDLSDNRTFQGDLFGTIPSEQELIKAERLMRTLDLVNRGNKNNVSIGNRLSYTDDKRFQVKERLSLRYTSCWEELPEVF